ncbi:MAG TPA: RcpC/CpaB family pilus assembly protein, partial [Chloroflexota bacterium]|nr:RcpC/CpaB family pilus assembly protein [Chloroflexota bacterium]
LAAGQMVMAIPIRTDAAAGGRIRAGDSVQVLGTTKQEGSTKVVLDRATVYDMGREQTTGLGNASNAQSLTSAGTATWMTLIVTSEQAQRLAQARWSSDLDVALLPPQPAQ